MAYNVGILGATGAVGQEIIRLLHEREFPIKELRLLASARSARKEQFFSGKTWTIQEATPESFEGLDVCIFSAGSDQSRLFADEAIKRGCVVVDNSSAFRQDPNVPLVIPEINPDVVDDHKGILANPNCSTAISLMGLYPLHKTFGLKSFIASTYQAVSGSGAGGIVELEQQARAWAEGGEIKKEVYPHQIAFNLLPHVDAFLDDGYTKEEMKMVLETRKIMSIPELPVSATCVRVPVLRAHSESIWVETETKISEARARELFVQAPGIQLVDEQKPGGYPVPWEASETFDTYVGRVREDLSHPRGLTFWCVADQLYKGAALNAIQIAEVLLESRI